MVDDDPARPLLVALLVVAAGCSHGAAGGAKRPALAVVHLTAHAGATALWGNAKLTAGATQDWDKPGAIRLSRGDGPIARTIDAGWVIGVVGEQLYFLRPTAGTNLEIARVGLTGDPIVIATVPREDPERRPTAAVTGTGTVAIVARSLDAPAIPADPVLDRHAADLMLVDATGPRRIPLLEPGEYAVALVANPDGPEVVAVATNRGGSIPGRGSDWIALFDTATATMRWRQSLSSSWISTGGETAFTDHDLIVNLGNDVVRLALATGASTVEWTEVHIDARNLEFDRAGKRAAYTINVGSGDGAWADPACHVMVIDAADPEMRTRDPLERYDGGCYFGIGLLWVDGALWVAPAK